MMGVSAWNHFKNNIVQWIRPFIKYPGHVSISVIHSGFLAVGEISIAWSCIHIYSTFCFCISSRFVSFSNWWTPSHSYLSNYHIMIERRLVYSLFGHFVNNWLFNKFSFVNRRKVLRGIPLANLQQGFFFKFCVNLNS